MFENVEYEDDCIGSALQRRSKMQGTHKEDVVE